MSQVWNAEFYDQKHSFVYEYGESLIEILDPKPGERILDLGCGTGHLTKQISTHTENVMGMDYSEDMIEEAKGLFSGVDFCVGDAGAFQFPEPFDAIFSNAALHWVRNAEGCVQSMSQNLKPGGRVVAEFGGKGNIQTIESQLKKSLAKSGFKKQAEKELWYFPSIAEYSTLLEKYGFDVKFAQHFERPTRLADKNAGIKDWLTMFGKAFFEGVDSDAVEEIKEEVQECVRPYCLKGGNWFADYKRLRVVAVKG